MQDISVEKLNSMLKELNYPVTNMDEVQGKAVRGFQNDFGLNVTGVFDKDTLNALNRITGEDSNLIQEVQIEEPEVKEKAVEEEKRNEGVDEIEENKEIDDEIHMETKKKVEEDIAQAEEGICEDEKRTTINEINEEIRKILMNGF